MFPVVLLPSCGGMYVRGILIFPQHIYTCAFPPFLSLFLVFISPFLHLGPSHFFWLLSLSYLRQECKFL